MPALRHGHAAGHTRSGTYNSWRAMIERCTYEPHPRYPHYGGRGIQVDPRWQGRGGFDRFLADMGERPTGRTLDREDVNGHYTPANCRWATIHEQRWNRRDMAERVDDAPEEFHVTPLYEVASPVGEREALPF